MAGTQDSQITSVADRLHSTAIHLLRKVRPEDRAMGLGAAQLSALSILVFGGERTIGLLAQAEQVSAPTMTRIVDGLSSSGLAVRQVDPADRRSVRVSATPKGRQLLHDGRQRRVALLALTLEVLKPSEIATIGSALDLLAGLFLPKARSAPGRAAGARRPRNRSFGSRRGLA